MEDSEREHDGESTQHRQDVQTIMDMPHISEADVRKILAKRAKPIEQIRGEQKAYEDFEVCR